MRRSDIKRVKTINSYHILDSPSEKEYDDIAKLAASICGTPIALVTLLDYERQFFKAKVGIDIDETPIEHAFCTHAVEASDEIFIIEDAREDDRFKNNPYVTSDPHVVFYAGVPLVAPNGAGMGTLCVIDDTPKKLSETQKEALQALANQVMQLFELRKTHNELSENKKILKKENQRLNNIISVTNVGTWEWHIETSEVFVNHRWADMIGFSIEELAPINLKTWYMILHPEDVGLYEQNMQACFDKKQEFFDIECRIYHKNGQVVWIHNRGQVTEWSDDGKPLIVSGSHEDITEKKEIEVQILKSEQYYRALVENGSDGIAIINIDGSLSYISPSISRILGYSETEALQLNLFEVVHPEDIPALEIKMQSVFENPGVPMEGHTSRVQHKNGSWRWLEATITNMLHDPNINGIVDNFRDVTDRIHKDKLIADSEKRFKALVQEGADLTAILDWEGIYQYISPSYGPNLGYTEADLLGANGFSFVHPEDREFARPEYEKLAHQERVRLLPYRFKNKAGEWRWIQSTCTNLLDDPAIMGIVVNSIDITDLIRTQRNLQESNERYELINKATNEAIYEWDIVADIFYWGDAFKRVFGHDFQEEKFTISTWASFMHPVDDEKNKGLWEKFLNDKHEHLWQKEYRFRKADGNYAYVEETGHLIRNKKGQPIKMIGVIRDVSDSKIIELQKQIQQEIAQYFKDQTSLRSTLQYTVRHLTEFGEYHTSEIWIVSEEKEEIHLIAYHGKDTKSEKLYEQVIEKNTLAKGQGLPGHTWESLSVEVWDDIDTDPRFIRYQSAQKAGLKSAFSIPITHNEQFLGVLLVTNARSLSEDHYKTAIFTDLGKFLGAEIKRKQQEEEMYLLFHSAPEILAITSPNGYFKKVNAAFCKLMSYTEQELTSQPFTNFVHPEDLDKTSLEYVDTITGKRQARNFINRYITKSGEYRWISWDSSEVFGEDGFVFSYGRDISDIIELQHLLDRASKLSRVGGWEIDLENQNLYWSDITREIHEVDKNYKIDLESAINFYREDFKDQIKLAVEAAIKNQEIYDFEAVIITANGNERWVRTIGEIESIDGKVKRIYGSFQDIHDKKITELRLKNLSDNIPGVIFQYILKPDMTDQLMYVSKGSHLIWGRSPEACMADSKIIWERIAMAGDQQHLQQTILESAENLTYWHAKWRYLSPTDGQIKYHEGFGNPQKMADGTILWDSIILDITEKNDLELLAQRTAKMARIGNWKMDIIEDETDKMYWSPMTKEILEVPESYNPSLSGGLEFYEGESKERITAAIDKLIKSGEEFDLELLLKTYTGKSRWNRVIGHADVINGKSTRIYGSIQDIDKQKKTEIAIQKSLEERNTILESIGDAFFAVDKNWKVLYWNKQAEKILYTKREDIIGKLLWDVFEDAKSLNSFKQYSKAMETGQTVHFEDYYPPINSWFEISAYPSAEGLSVYFKDVSIRKIAEMQIKESNERFEKISEATNDAIWDYDILGQKLFWGKGFEELFGYRLDQITPSFELLISKIHPEDRQQISDKIMASMADPHTNNWFEEYRFKQKDGTYAYVIDRAVFIRDSAGQVTRVVGAMTDISQRKAYEEYLKQLNEQLEKHTRDLEISNKELEQFAYVASHDLQEPLRMITSFISLLDKKYGDQLDEKAHQYINFAVDGAKRMRQIILDLLEFSRIGKVEDKIKKIDIQKIVDEICSLERRRIQEKKAVIHYENLPEIASYEIPVRQVFNNLIGNALKYSKTNVKPEIEISAKALKDEWHFQIKDNGIGINESYFEKIFIIFQRLHGKDEYGGTGMGLAIVKKIIDNLGGRIWVESKEGEGSTFHFTLPKTPNS